MMLTYQVSENGFEKEIEQWLIHREKGVKKGEFVNCVKILCHEFKKMISHAIKSIVLFLSGWGRNPRWEK